MEKSTGGCMPQPSNGLQDMVFAYGPVKELSHVALVQDVQTTLDKWRNSKTFLRGMSSQFLPDKGVLVGDLAMSFYAKLCVQESGEFATHFPSRESLWLDHLFEPFLKWVNEKLAHARWLQISCIGDRGATWAQLIRGEIALSESDHTLYLMHQLKRLDGEPIYDGGTEDVTNLIISLKSETSYVQEAGKHRGDQS